MMFRSESSDDAQTGHMDQHKRNRLFQRGLEAFNSAQFFEAHEHWEEVWLETPAPDKTFLQGLIQVAAAFHHYTRENRRGTQTLLEAGLTKLEPFPSVHWGLEIAPLRDCVRQWLTALAIGDAPDPDIPCIHSGGSGGASSKPK
jgi:predicted metal-dependent hydrolase